MNSEDKVERLKKVTALFDQFVEHLGVVRGNMDNQSLYAEGYAACIADILEGLKEGKDSEIISAIKTKIDMDSKKEVLDEMQEGLSNIYAAYKNILNEE